MLLAIDVGKGTEDVICWDKTSPIENAIQLVMPSSAQILKKRISDLLDPEKPLYITGDIIAGEPWHKVVYDHCKEYPGTVVMDETAAKSLRYNLAQVRERGITVVKSIENAPEDRLVVLSDIVWERLRSVLSYSDDVNVEAVLLCCQDHGEPSDRTRSVRDFRMTEIYKGLEKTGRIEDLLLCSSGIPHTLPRLQSIATSASRNFPQAEVFVMDSSPAVVLGTIIGEGLELVVNAGNGHTIAMILNDSEVQSVFEHHTGLLDENKLERHLKRLILGELSHREIMDERGHGVYYRTPQSSGDLPVHGSIETVLIGPNRGKFSGLGRMGHPGGNMMMAGPIGLIKAYLYKKQKE